MQTKLLKGNNIELLKTLEDNSIDSIITDPPYGLSFMNKKWDYDVPSVELWKEVYRVLKPGGHILSFGGTRTYHRMVVNIEDAGFEIRDCIQWIYGSGFPKSLNIGKAMDKLEGKEVFVGKGFNVAGQGIGLNQNKELRSDNPNYVKPTYENEWNGWGTGLKPANEPIVMARKPIDQKTIVENVKEWGTGGINIDGCRITLQDGENTGRANKNGDNGWKNSSCGLSQNKIRENNGEELLGRFPSNVILDEEAAEMMDEQSNGSRFFYISKVSKKERNMGLDYFEDKETKNKLTSIHRIENGEITNDRNTPIHKNNHPTVKPINLLTYLIRLITPPNGVVLDMYMGSGSTGIAALLEGKQFIGMEMDEEYFKIAEARINNYEQYRQLIKK